MEPFGVLVVDRLDSTIPFFLLLPVQNYGRKREDGLLFVFNYALADIPERKKALFRPIP
jgi:hypothetical protein